MPIGAKMYEAESKEAAEDKDSDAKDESIEGEVVDEAKDDKK